eukprot:PhF_6_TR42410/c0_g1_i1/m.63968
MYDESETNTTSLEERLKHSLQLVDDEEDSHVPIHKSHHHNAIAPSSTSSSVPPDAEAGVTVATPRGGVMTLFDDDELELVEKLRRREEREREMQQEELEELQKVYGRTLRRSLRHLRRFPETVPGRTHPGCGEDDEETDYLKWEQQRRRHSCATEE